MLYVVEIVMVFHYCPPASSLRRKSYFWLPDRAPGIWVVTGVCPRNGDATRRLRTRSDTQGPPQIKQAVRPRENGRQGGLWEFWCWCWGMMVLCGVGDEGLVVLRA